MKNIITLLLIAFLSLCIDSCKKEKSLTNYTDAVTCNEADDNLNIYNGKIGLLLNTHCASSGCHSAGSHKAGRDFSTYINAKSGFDAESLCSINHDSGCEAMPDGAAKLSNDIIHDLTCWVKNGYPQ